MENSHPLESKAIAVRDCCAPAGKKGWLSVRTMLIGIAALGGGALFLGWDWLAAAGLASFIVGVLPCLVMCALGVCASRMGKKDTPVGKQ